MQVVIRADSSSQMDSGYLMRCFEDENSFLDDLSHYFSDISVGSIKDDCFGWNYHWHLAVCVKKRFVTY